MSIHWKVFWERAPGVIAGGLMILITCFWTYWGVAETFYEGWGLPFPDVLRYIIIPAGCLILSLIALTWPYVGGGLLILCGALFTAFWISVAAGRGWLNWQWLLGTFPLSGMVVLLGVLFILEGRYRRKQRQEGVKPPENWFRRNLWYLLAIGSPMLVVLGLTAFYAPLLHSRVDDGERGATLIKGNGVALVWAPQGPGWNWKQTWGGYPSWDSLAFYGVSPLGLDRKPIYEERHASLDDMDVTGLCRYLSEDGVILMDEPQNIWRLPTTDEVVRSLVRGGESAGCSWDGESSQAQCNEPPNKDTPLWAPDEEPIYYWTADEYDDNEAWYVPYNGGIKYGGAISQQPKDWGNPRHGYRCVREP